MSNIGLGITGSIDKGGIKHFTNWDSSLTSIKYQGKELLTKKSPSNFLEDYTFRGALNQAKKIEFGAADVKIVDNIAAVSYPDYTDIHKTVRTVKPNPGSNYIPMYVVGKGFFNYPNSQDTSWTNVFSYPDGYVIIPIFDFSFIKDFLLTKSYQIGQDPTNYEIADLDLDGLYITITYQGEVSTKDPNDPSPTGEFAAMSGLANKRQILKWCPPGFITSEKETIYTGKNDIGSDKYGYLPPGYFSIRSFDVKNVDSGCLSSVSCNVSKKYFLVANIGLSNSFLAPNNYSLWTCDENITQLPVIPTPPPVTPPDLYGEFSSFEEIDIQEQPSQLYSSGACYVCENGECIQFGSNPMECIPVEGITLYSSPDCDGACGSSVVYCNCCVNGICVETQFPSGTDCNNVCASCATIGETCGTDNIQDCYFDFNISTSATIKCSEITLIKYKPAVECGKVDLYSRKQGNISSLASGVAACANHGLLHGDVIKTFGVSGSTVNGIFYVGEIINENSFKLFKEKELSTPILETVSNVKWYQIEGAGKTLFDNGVVASSSASTIVSSGKIWTTNQWANYQVKIYAGTGIGQVRTISSNTASQITITSNWATNPDSTSLFEIVGSNENMWGYYATLFSPMGKNGYGVFLESKDWNNLNAFNEKNIASIILNKAKSRESAWVRESTLSSSFNNKKNFDEIFIEDYFGSIDFSYTPSNNRFFWNHYKIKSSIGEIGQPIYPNWYKSGEDNSATLMDIYSVFPVDQKGYIQTTLITDRPISTYDIYLENINFEYDGKIRTNINYDTSYDATSKLWGSAYNLVNGFRFGASIDLRKNNNGTYSLLVGEQGLDTVLSTAKHNIAANDDLHPWGALGAGANTYYDLPSYVHGSAYIFVLTTDANNNIQPLTIGYEANDFSSGVDLSNIYTAYTQDSSIGIPRPLNIGFGEVNVKFNTDVRSIGIPGYGGFSLGFGGFVYDLGGYQENIRLYNNQEIFNGFFDWNKIQTFSLDEYWYGGMIYGLADINGGNTYINSGIFTLEPNYDQTPYCSQNGYFSDLTIPNIKSAAKDNYYSRSEKTNQLLKVGFYRDAFDIYPYVDSFGKSVAFDENDPEYVFAASRVKIYVYRPDAGDLLPPGYTGSTSEINCRNSLMPYSYVGYVHTFKNGIKQQTIFDSSNLVSLTPSLSWVSHYHKADNFAECIVAKNSKLYWGQAKPIEISDDPVSWSYEKSKIFVYNKMPTQFVLGATIENVNDRGLSYAIQLNKDSTKVIIPDFKEYFLRNKLDSYYLDNEVADINDVRYFYPSDRFGTNFKVGDNVLVVNAFDDRNELGDIHNQTRWPYTEFSEIIPTNDYFIEFNKTLDYLHIYKFIDNTWVFSQKIAPSFNYDDENYKYFSGDYIESAANNLRSIANINYNNTIDKSITWDIDLTGAFDIVDNRLIVKDPVNLSIFQQDIGLLNNNELSIFPRTSFKTVYLEPYLTYDETFSAEYLIEKDCNILFSRLGDIYSDAQLNSDRQVIYKSVEEVDGDRNTTIKTPIFFVNIPKGNLDYYSIQQLKIIVDEIPSNITNPNLKLVLYRKDPRQTIQPNYIYDQLTCLPAESSLQIRSRSDIAEFKPYVGGAFDLSLYDLSSFRNSANYTLCGENSTQGFCLAKVINSASTIIAIDGRKSNVYEISLTDLNFSLNDFIVKENLISSNTRTFNGRIQEQLILSDISSIGYDSSISVEDSLIIGFTFDSDEYAFNATNIDYESEIDLASITARIKYSASNLGSDSTSLRNYKCVSSDVKPINGTQRVINYYSNKEVDPALVQSPTLKYLNSSIAISKNNLLPALNDLAYDIYPGCESKGYTIISIDEFSSGFARTFDIQKMEFLPLNISGETFTKYTSTTPVVIIGPVSSNSNITGFIDGFGPIGQTSTLYTAGPINSVGSISLFTRSANFIASPYLDYPNLFIRSENQTTGNANLSVTAMSPKIMPLYLETVKPFTEQQSLFIKSLYENQDASLFVYGRGAETQSANLTIKADIAFSAATLQVAGPSQVTSFDSPYSSCFITDTNYLFDISSGAELEIADLDRNSLAYIGDDSYATKDVNIQDFATYSPGNNYEFYFSKRENTSIASNDNFLCLATNVDPLQAIASSFPSDESPLPKIEVYSINQQNQVELVFTYDNFKNDLESIDSISGLIDDSYFIANVVSLAISENNRIAVSLNVILRKFTGGDVKLNCIVILEKEANSWARHSIISKVFTATNYFEDIGNLVGLHLQWVNEDLYFSQNEQNQVLDSVKIARLSNNFQSENLGIDITKTDIYTQALQQNISLFGFLEKCHFGFGHKFIAHNDVMFVAAPYVHPYYSVNVAPSTALNSPYGAVFIFKKDNNSWSFVSTIFFDAISSLNSAASNSFGAYSAKMFGYDLFYDSSLETLIVGQPGSSQAYRFLANKNTWILQETISGDNIGQKVLSCNSNEVILSKNNNGKIFVNQDAFEYDPNFTLSELAQYDSNIENYSEKIISVVPFVNEKLLAIRKFTADNQTITKISLLNKETLNIGSLFLKTFTPISNAATLFYKTPEFAQNGARLRMPKANAFAAEDLSLFISTTELNSIPLYLKTLDPADASYNISSYIYGSVVSVSVFNKQADLFLLGKSDLYKLNENQSPLFIGGPNKDTTTSSSSLYIGNIWNVYNGNTTLHTGGNSSGSNVPIDQLLIRSASLYIASAYVDSNASSLFINTQEGGDAMSLFLDCKQSILTAPLVIDATYGASNGVNLVIKDTVGGNTEDMFIYLNGFRR